MIEIINFTRKYGNFTAVDNLSLTIEPGKIFGLLGPNGAGKSTTVKSITGAIRPTAGKILVNQFDIVTQATEAKAQIGYIPENAAVFKNLTGREYLDFTGSLYNVPRQTRKTRSEELLNRFGLTESADHQIFSYSKGMTQKLMIAAAILHNPDILILDEPLSGLDANAALLFKKTLRSFADRGKTILFCSHILEVVEKVCDSIAVMYNGKMLAAGTAAEIIQQTASHTLEEAFMNLTGETDIDKEAADIITALA